MRITLTVTAGPHKGRVFTFVGHDTFLVGRSSRAHFRLPVKDRYFSRVHFLIEVNPPECALLDMGSRNGTYVNGARVDRCNLRDGDRIRAGPARRGPARTGPGAPAGARRGGRPEADRHRPGAGQGVRTGAPAQPQVGRHGPGGRAAAGPAVAPTRARAGAAAGAGHVPGV